MAGTLTRVSGTGASAPPGPRSVIAALGVAVCAVTAELLAGRPPVCRCGRVRLWSGTVNGPENSQQLADWYSLSHVVHGLIAYAALRWLLPRTQVGTRLIVAAVVEAAWELIENTPTVIDRYRAATIALGYYGDSVLNSAADIGFMVLGFLVASRLPAWAAVALGVALELLALAVIRDNLTLNVLMLVHPIPAIREWQGAL